MKVIIILYSLCVALLMLTKSISISLFMTLLVIEYGFILLSNHEFRLMVKNKFKVNKTFGSENKSYGQIHLKTLKEDIEKMEPDAFKLFVADVFKELGYKVSQAEKDFGGDLILTKGESSTLVELRHQEKSTNAVDNQAVECIVTAIKVYKATNGMVVTNATFTDKAYQAAKVCDIDMIDGIEFNNLVRQVMLEDTGNTKEDSEDKKSQDIESVLADTIAEVTLEEALDRIPTVMMDEQVLTIHPKEKSHNAHQN